MTEPTATSDRVFYRIIRGEQPVLDDFKSARALGKPLRNRKLVRQWAEGISTYDRLDRAIEVVRLYDFKLGRRIVALRIPANAGIEHERWETDPHHHTLYGEPAILLGFADERPILVEEE